MTVPPDFGPDPVAYRNKRYEEERKAWLAKFRHVREMLNSYPGQKLMEELKRTAMNPPGGMYVQGSFDRTAFNMGVLFVYQMFEDIAKGEDNGGG